MGATSSRRKGLTNSPPFASRREAARRSNTTRPLASAQVKSALLLAGLFAKGKTTVNEPSASRNHTELMLNYFLVRTVKEEDGSGISVFGDQTPESRDFTFRATFLRPRFGWSPRARNRAVIYWLGGAV